MRGQRKQPQPQVERRGEEEASDEREARAAALVADELQHENGRGETGQDEPDIEVDKQVADIEVGRAGAEGAGALAAKDVVPDEVEGRDDRAVVEEEVNGDLQDERDHGADGAVDQPA